MLIDCDGPLKGAHRARKPSDPGEMPVEITPRKARENDGGEQAARRCLETIRTWCKVDDDLQAGFTDRKCPDSAVSGVPAADHPENDRLSDCPRIPRAAAVGHVIRI